MREIFGFETKIKSQPCSQQEPQNSPEPKIHSQEDEDERPAYMDTVPEPSSQEIQQENNAPFQQDSQPASMTEEVETESGSCVTGCNDTDESTTEFDGNSILEEPMIKKATELFEATKITVQHKV